MRISPTLSALAFALFGSNAVPQGLLDSGAPPATRHQLAGDWYYGGRLEAEYLHEKDYDLDRSAGDEVERLTLVHPSLAFSWRPDRTWTAYVNFEYQKHLFLLGEGRPGEGRAELNLDKLYLEYRGEAFRARLGRQRVKNPREWMIDDTQDGLRLQLRREGLDLDLALLRERAFTEDLLHGDENRRVDSLWLRLSAEPREEMEAGAFLMLQEDRDRDERAGWIGVDLAGEWEDLDYWFQGAVVRGERRGRSLSGYGFDLGGVLRLHREPRIYAIAGYAFGSGDRDDADLGFRQTGFQDNAAKLGGVTRMYYYGELFDPELSNMGILTLGIGMRPVRNLSVNLVWHDYRQHRALDELRDSALDIEPSGDDRHLGSEIDLVAGYRIRGRFKVEAVLGRFRPGDAFDRRDTATLARIEIKYNW